MICHWHSRSKNGEFWLKLERFKHRMQLLAVAPKLSYNFNITRIKISCFRSFFSISKIAHFKLFWKKYEPFTPLDFEFTQIGESLTFRFTGIERNIHEKKFNWNEIEKGITNNSQFALKMPKLSNVSNIKWV